MLKDYLKESNKSIYLIAKESGIPYSTLNDLANGKVEIGQCRVRLLQKLAETLGLTMEETCDICSSESITVSTEYHLDTQIVVKSKSYYSQFTYMGEPITIELCKVNEDTRFYIEEIAAWRTEEYIRNRRLQEF